MTDGLFTFTSSDEPTDVKHLSDDKLVSTIEEANKAYRSGEPIVSDETFDHVLLEELKSREPEHPFLSSVQPEPVLTAKGRVQHPKKMLSTDKAYTVNDMEKWLAKVIKSGVKCGIPPQDIIIEATTKLDGISGRFTPELAQLVTRGDGEFGTDISDFYKAGVVIKGDMTKPSIGEIVVSKAYFEANLSDTFAHSRNFVSGIAGSDTINEHGLKALKDGAVEFVIFSDMPRLTVSAVEFLDKFEAMEEALLQSDYDLDGVVFDVANPPIQADLGYTNHHPVYRIAKKRINDIQTTTVTGIRWQNGRTGTISPVLEVAEVRLSNSNVTSITAHHAGYLLKNKLGIGAVIKCVKSGEIIPKVLETISPVEAELLTHCESCNTPTILEGDFLKCENPYCEQTLVSAMVHGFQRLGIDLFGRKTCEKLVKNNITNICEAIILSQADFIRCGLGQGQALNLVNEISRAKTEPIKDSHLLASVAINNLGRGTSEKILGVYNIKDILSLSYEQLIAIDGIGELTATTIVDELSEKGSMLTFLLDLGFNITDTKRAVSENQPQPLAGLVLVFTGVMNSGSRSEIEETAKLHGCKVGKTISKNSSYLVIGDKVGASKMNKAKDLGVEIITEDEYLARFF